MRHLLLLTLIISCAHKTEKKVYDFSKRGPSSEVKSCGLVGPVSKRIKECDATKGNFVLVTRSAEELVYKDLKTGLLWGSRKKFDANFYGAGRICQEIYDDDIYWMLPSLDEFHEAQLNGLSDVLTDTSHWFWTSTAKGKKHRRNKKVWLWNGETGEGGEGAPEEAASVRCVGRRR